MVLLEIIPTISLAIAITCLVSCGYQLINMPNYNKELNITAVIFAIVMIGLAIAILSLTPSIFLKPMISLSIQIILITLDLVIIGHLSYNCWNLNN